MCQVRDKRRVTPPSAVISPSPSSPLQPSSPPGARRGASRRGAHHNPITRPARQFPLNYCGDEGSEAAAPPRSGLVDRNVWSLSAATGLGVSYLKRASVPAAGLLF